jgi:hypothetical protein
VAHLDAKASVRYYQLNTLSLRRRHHRPGGIAVLAIDFPQREIGAAQFAEKKPSLSVFESRRASI